MDGIAGETVQSLVEGDITPVNGRAITPHQNTAEIIAGENQTKPWHVTRTAVQLPLPVNRSLYGQVSIENSKLSGNFYPYQKFDFHTDIFHYNSNVSIP